VSAALAVFAGVCALSNLSAGRWSELRVISARQVVGSAGPNLVVLSDHLLWKFLGRKSALVLHGTQAPSDLINWHFVSSQNPTSCRKTLTRNVSQHLLLGLVQFRRDEERPVVLRELVEALA
jgi:hypothetical protein